MTYYVDHYTAMRRNLHYFTYKIYRVDPLTRENLSESGVYGVDDPLLTIRYGANTDSLQCKLPLKLLEREIKKRRPELNWQGYQDGELYRIVLSVEEYLDFGDGIGRKSLKPAETETSILFRCYSKTVETGAQYNSNLFTPLRWEYNASTADSTANTSGQQTLSGKLELQDAIASDRVAQITLINGKAGMTDCFGHRKVFDLYYQWWEVTENGKPVRLLAGTDNVYDSSMGPKSMHDPGHWNFNYVKPDGTKYQYCNTVDPLDPDADSYDTNGLPKVGKEYKVDWVWRDDQIHLYSTQTTEVTRLTADGTDNLYLENNKIYETGTDRCYIPQDMAGKYLQVKVIALNGYWPEAFDSKQTFESQIVQVVDTHGELKMKAETSYSDGKNYAAYNHPATLSVSDVITLDEGEYISSVEYYTGGVKPGCKPSIVFDNLKITDPAELPKVQYPNDFYDAADEAEWKKMKAHDVCYQVLIETSKGGKILRDSFIEAMTFRYEVEPESFLKQIHDEETFKLSDIRAGKCALGIQAFSHSPGYATVGFCDYTGGTNTNPAVAVLDETGRLFFGGSCGETTISFKRPDGEAVSVTITVIHDYDCFEISGIKPPVCGEKLDFTSPAVPDDAPYRITDVKWYAGYDEAGKNDTVEYFKPYRIEVTVESNEYCRADELSDWTMP